MIPDKALSVSRRMDKLATERFGEEYTLKTTFWNDGDFRIVVYSSKDADALDVEEAERAYVELWYQDSKVRDGKAVEVQTIQDEAGPRAETVQSKIRPETPVTLPQLSD